MGDQATYNIIVPTSNHVFMAIRRDWFKVFVCSWPGAVHDCYIADISKNFKNLFQSD